MPVESPSERQARAAAVLAALELAYPEAATELDYRNPFELLIATMLSAQATDSSVNRATPALFEAFPDAATLARAEPDAVEPFIRSIGLYRTKARNLVATARRLSNDFEGQVPNQFDALVSLPGVGRKTANVVLAGAFGRPAIAVDTHVGRLARRLGFSHQEHPDRVERDLQALFPETTWIFVHHALILHGRRVCHARTPKCQGCDLRSLCPGRQS